jgi:hypothetical protein
MMTDVSWRIRPFAAAADRAWVELLWQAANRWLGSRPDLSAAGLYMRPDGIPIVTARLSG